MNRTAVLAAAYDAVIAIGDEPSRRTVQEMSKRICGKAFHTADVLGFLAAKRGATVPLPYHHGTTSVPDTTLNSVDLVPPADDAGTRSRASAMHAGAGDNVLVKDSAQGVDILPPPPPSRPEIESPAPAPAPFAVPAPPAAATPPSKPKRVAYAVKFAGVTIADFGPFAADVEELMGVEASLGGRCGALGPKTAEDALKRLAYLREHHGDDAFANGVRVGIESGKGVTYASGAIRRFDPASEGAAARPASGEADRRPYFSPADRAFWDGIMANLPTGPEIDAEARERGEYVEPLVILPHERPPFHPEYRPAPRQAAHA